MEKAEVIQSDSTSRQGKGWLLLGLSLGYFMVLLDTTVVNVALPAIRSDLGGGMTGLQWVVNAYTIVFAGLLLSMGALADKLGAKRVYAAGLAVFLAASAGCAAAPTLGVLIGMRGVLGIGGAALMSASLTLIGHTYPGPAERARALGIWAAVTGAAMAAGPVVGGLLVDSFGWRSMFLINVPIAVLSLILTMLLITETKRKPEQGFDLAGQTTAIAAIAALSYALMEANDYGWSSPVIIGTVGFAAACIILFLYAQARGRSPLLPLKLFRSATVSAGMVAGLAINIGLSGVLFVVPMFLQQSRGLSAHTTGLVLLALTIPLALNPMVTGRIVSRIGARLPMTLGFALTAAGTVLESRADAADGYGLICAGLLLIGFGVSFTIPSMMAAVMSSVSKDQTGTASGALNSSRQLGATVGVALAGSMLSSSGSIIEGMHRSLVVTAIVLLGGSLLSYAFIGRKTK
ncbi:MFS transporter [Paenibacillus doosanensis]|uniref:Multidrug resistance protein stp n=1 Tax=Paenibacillus konkukensis TaxID=2020716 RepID=A0ABY4RXV9_9BACL|nr:MULTISPECIES: MFS transporter [Paenibacillus]MCS7460466.1 MFS transporter [Paenibacillus doosanensis]UQZ87496.1 Multidrug resistance protein stp [Paenibacillus konkukensis]